MIIKSKKHLSSLVLENLPKYKLVETHFKAAILNLLDRESLAKLLEINLIRYLATKDNVISNFENYLSQKAFTNINVPISRLKSNFIMEYYSVLAELESAKRLKDEGMTNIKFLPSNNNPDIEFIENGKKKYAEVKNFMEINPEFTILNDKLEAKSLRNKNFQRSFTVDCEYDLKDYDSIDNLHKAIHLSTTGLIKQLSVKLKLRDMEDEIFRMNSMNFKISTNQGKAGYFMMLHSSKPFVFSSVKDSFLEFSSVYTRFISQFRRGYLQLLKKRSSDISLVETDRIYMYLRLGMYTHFIPKEAKRIFIQLSRITGMSELVNLKIQL